jgi:hypothetical protein
VKHAKLLLSDLVPLAVAGLADVDDAERAA